MHPSLATMLALIAFGNSPAGAQRTSVALPAAVVTFRGSAVVSGRVIRLGDIAVVEGRDRQLIARLEAVDVGSAPLRGGSRTVSADYSQVRIRQIGVNPARLQFHGPQLVTVSRPDQVLPGSALQKAACEAVEAANPGAAAQVTFAPADLRLPVGAVQLKAAGDNLVLNNSGSVVVQVLVAGHEEARVPVSFRLARLAPAVVALRDVPAGEVLTDADLRIEPRPAAPGLLVVSDLAQAVGQQAAAPIRSGSVLNASMLKAPLLVRRGMRVKLICKTATFVASVMGEALQDAAAGQPVRVRNLNSMREVTGVVTGEETAEVPF